MDSVPAYLAPHLVNFEQLTLVDHILIPSLDTNIE